MGEVDDLSWARGKGQTWSIEIGKERDTGRAVKRAEKVVEVEIWEYGTQRNSKDSGKATGLEKESEHGEDFQCKPVVSLKIVLMIYI